MYSACNIYFHSFVSIWKLEWRERRFNLERDVKRGSDTLLPNQFACTTVRRSACVNIISHYEIQLRFPWTIAEYHSHIVVFNLSVKSRLCKSGETDEQQRVLEDWDFQYFPPDGWNAPWWKYLDQMNNEQLIMWQIVNIKGDLNQRPGKS